MTPTRALVGLAVVAAAGYAVISSAGSDGPKYLGDMPSIMAKASAAPPPVTHFKAGPSVPDPPHFAAHPVVPEAAPAPSPGVPGPGPVGPAAPAGSGQGAGNGEPGAQPGIGGPPSTLPPGGLLSGLPLLGSVPTAPDLTKVCVDSLGQVFAQVPCSKLSPSTVIPPGTTFPPGTVFPPGVVVPTAG
jgi:hypothetical protein